MSKVVVGIISKESRGETEYLLISSKKDFGKFTGLYYPPGGHLEEGEDEKTALVREIYEELGVKVKVLERTAVTPGDVEGQTTYWYKCDMNSDNGFIIQQEEINDVRWFSEAEIKNGEMLWPATKSFFEKYILK